MHWGIYFKEVLIAAALCYLTEDAGKCTVFLFSVSHSFFVLVLSLLCCIVFIVCMNMMLSYMEEIKNLSIYLKYMYVKGSLDFK